MYKLNTVNKDILEAAKKPGNTLDKELGKYVRVGYYQIGSQNGTKDKDWTEI